MPPIIAAKSLWRIQGLANSLVWEAWEKQWIPHWRELKFGKKEVKVSDNTRFDMAFWPQDYGINVKKKIPPEMFDEHKFHFVEVKNVTMAEGNTALFPDAVTTRGQKHIKELISWVERGHSSELVFVIQRTDCTEFSPAKDIDPEYARLLAEAQKKGVRISPYTCKITKNKIELDPEQKIKLVGL